MSPEASGSAPPTVHSLHVMAEHVLGAALYAATGHIGLQVAPGGFGTPMSANGALGGRFAVSDGALVIARDGGTQEAPITTVAEAASFFGIEPGMPSSVYSPATALDLHAPLAVDLDQAEAVGDWFVLGNDALARFVEAHADGSPTSATLWPEHFDLGLSMAEINYGVSPGDDAHAEPYLYVGPWMPPQGVFWNEPFGASVAASQISSVEDAVAFFEQGRSLAT